MLKNLCLPSDYDSLTFKICGEIICQNEKSFIITCKSCDIKIFDFNEFVNHFRSIHWNDINLSDNLWKKINVKDEKFPLRIENQDEPIKTEEYSVKKISYEEHTSDDEWTLQIDATQTANIEDDAIDMETNYILKKKIEADLKEKVSLRCTICERTFSNKPYYESHLQKHKGDQFKCNKCNKTFAREDQFNHHLVIHNGYPCKLCTRVFKTYDSLRYHKETHIQTKNFVCDFKACNKAFATNRRLHIHKRTHFPEVFFVCEMCGSRQRNKQALTDHIRKHTGEKPFACNICGRKFATNSLMNEHKACHETERKHICDVCGKGFNRPKALYHHKPLHLATKKFVCKVCGAAYSQAAGLSAHMRKHKKDKITITETSIFGALFK